ncbi:MOSC domain-containing protein [Nocardioides insulae]|uniref:MOSC domain-containing protein n=1 Tax=Nocardioides insulae TaxID=394734 RepID=UPI000414AC89|nr:MOSC domain-containing protein [Nocardioides insulae]
MVQARTPHIVSVNVGRARARAYAGADRTAIDKRSVTGPVAVRRLGLAGDEQGNTAHHGGPDQAVFAFAREDLDDWARELGGPVRDGLFGENLTTAGIDVNAAEVGERWRVGSTLLELSYVRTPCHVFRSWMEVSGFDGSGWVKRYTRAGRPGVYLRVVEEGELRAGDPIEVVHRPGHGITAAAMFHAINIDRSRLPELLVIDGLATKVRARIDAHLGRQADGRGGAA